MKIVKEFNINGIDYKLEFLKVNYQNTHTAFSLHVYKVDDFIPCIAIQRSVHAKNNFRLHCSINGRKIEVKSMKEFKIEALKYLTNS